MTRRYRGIPADERRQQRRRLLLDGCLDLVGRDGTPAVTAESVSAAAKLTKRYFYESFADRDAVLVAALDELFTDLVARFHETVLPAKGQERSQAIAEVYLGVLCGDPRRARLYAEAPSVPALNARREEAIGAFTGLLVNDAVTDVMTDEVQRQLITRMVVTGVTDLVTSWLTGNVDVDRAALIEAIVAMGPTLDFTPPSKVKRSKKTALS